LELREGAQWKAIGFVDFSNRERHSRIEEFSCSVKTWGELKGITAAIWTDLGPKFKDKIHEVLILNNAITYLSTLRGEKAEFAEYIVRAPEQIQIGFRQQIQDTLDWY